MFVQPFRLVAIGLAAWCVAVVLCSLSKDAESFELLLAGRILSGVGEASFQCVAPPFIHEYAPPHQQTLWFGIFTVSSVLGSTFGAIAASTMASSPLGWSALFAIEGIVMLPFVGVCLYGVPARYNAVPPSETTGETQRLLSSTETKPTFWGQLQEVCCNRIFLWVSAGGAAINFAMSGLGLFANLLLIGLKVFSNETDANVMTGLPGIVAFLVGALLGGVLLDWTTHGAIVRRQFFALRQLFVGMIVSVVVLCLSLAVLPSRTWYLIWTNILSVVYAAIAPTLLVALLHGAKPSHRGLVTGINAVVLHVLGDVPAPIIIGWVKDKVAPHCNSVLVQGIVQLNPACADDKDGLMLAMGFPVVGCLCAVVCFGAAFYLSWRSLPKQISIHVV